MNKSQHSLRTPLLTCDPRSGVPLTTKPGRTQYHLRVAHLSCERAHPTQSSPTQTAKAREAAASTGVFHSLSRPLHQRPAPSSVTSPSPSQVVRSRPYSFRTLSYTLPTLVLLKPNHDKPALNLPLPPAPIQISALSDVAKMAEVLGLTGAMASSGTATPEATLPSQLKYIQYSHDLEESYLPSIRALISKDLSEPYSIYVYRYFLCQWAHLCFMVSENECAHV